MSLSIQCWWHARISSRPPVLNDVQGGHIMTFGYLCFKYVQLSMARPAFKMTSDFSVFPSSAQKHILQNYDFLALCLKITKYGLYILRSFCLKMIQMRVHVWIGIWNDLKYLFGTSLCSPLDRFARSECFMALSQNSTRETPCSILLSPQK